MTLPASPTTATRTLTASEFEARCQELLTEVAESGEQITITKDGTPVCQIVPAPKPPRKGLKPPWGEFSYMGEIVGDITSPIDVEWNAVVNPDRVLNP